MLKFNPVVFHAKYKVIEPACPIKEGQKVVTFTLDAHGGSLRGSHRLGFSNPLTGPFVIENARPGDSMVIQIDSIQPLSENSWSYAYPRPWLMEMPDAAEFPDKKAIPWTLNNESGFASCACTGERTISVPMQPMLGCVGLASEPGTEATSQDAGPFGGNLDFPLLGAGAQLELPVFVPGGFLFMGDAHAIQFGGEITGAAIEIPAEVEFSATLKKGAGIPWPRGETQDRLFALGTEKPFEIAIQHAVSGMIRLFQDKFGLSHEEATALTGQLGDLQVCNMVSSTYTAACVVSKSMLSALA
jgi:amidase